LSRYTDDHDHPPQRKPDEDLSTPASFPCLIAVLLMPVHRSILPLSSNESIPFLNPDTYLNHVPPSEGAAIDFSNDVFLFILGVSNYIIKWL
jgi:hypothetical protein